MGDMSITINLAVYIGHLTRKADCLLPIKCPYNGLAPLHPTELDEDENDEPDPTESQPQVPSHLISQRSAGRLFKVVAR